MRPRISITGSARPSVQRLWLSFRAGKNESKWERMDASKRERMKASGKIRKQAGQNESKRESKEASGIE